MILGSAGGQQSLITEVTVMCGESPLSPLPSFVLSTGGVPLRPVVVGGSAEISDDPDNRLTLGTDEKLLVPEITIDLLALYILARS